MSEHPDDSRPTSPEPDTPGDDDVLATADGDDATSTLTYFVPRVEALLFAAEEPLRDDDLTAVLPGLLEPGVEAVMLALDTRYREGGHALTVQRVAGGWRLATHADYADLVRSHLKGRLRGRLSRAALETVSIIAYRQPVSRAEIEQLRGVDSSATLRHLLDRGLVTMSGRADSPGRPMLYATTEAFLTYFGLDHLSELPDPTETLAEPDDAERGHEVQIQRGPFTGTDSGVEEETYRSPSTADTSAASEHADTVTDHVDPDLGDDTDDDKDTH